LAYVLGTFDSIQDERRFGATFLDLFLDELRQVNQPHLPVNHITVARNLNEIVCFISIPGKRVRCFYAPGPRVEHNDSLFFRYLLELTLETTDGISMDRVASWDITCLGLLRKMTIRLS